MPYRDNTFVPHRPSQALRLAKERHGVTVTVTQLRKEARVEAMVQAYKSYWRLWNKLRRRWGVLSACHALRASCELQYADGVAELRRQANLAAAIPFWADIAYFTAAKQYARSVLTSHGRLIDLGIRRPGLKRDGLPHASMS